MKLRQFYLFLCIYSCTSIQAGEWSSSIAAEGLAFSQTAAFAGQHNGYLSVALETEYIHAWNGGDDLFSFKPFYRQDQFDENRSHGDIRELSWIHASADWEFLAGISKVYWGVTEAAHLVDIINQTDAVENLDGEDKLGQPMLKLTLIKDWGVADFFILPGFRERTFPSIEGRPRLGAVVNTTNVNYQSSDGNKHIDYAVRWSDTLGDWDVGLSYFKGTSREPRLSFVGGGLIQTYDIIGQVGLDVQAIIEDWLIKLETISRSGQGSHFISSAAGVEVTLVGINETDIDLGIIAEYLYDERSTAAFQNDLVLGARIVMNDVQSTELLISTIYNLDGDGQSYNIEGTRRIGENFKISVEARGVSNLKATSSLLTFKKDNRIRGELTYYF